MENKAHRNIPRPMLSILYQINCFQTRKEKLRGKKFKYSHLIKPKK